MEEVKLELPECFDGEMGLLQGQLWNAHFEVVNFADEIYILVNSNIIVFRFCFYFL